ncbi:MAG: hypothetical protein ACFCUU_00640 [Cyclobacteriaceae bacterium]
MATETTTSVVTGLSIKTNIPEAIYTKNLLSNFINFKLVVIAYFSLMKKYVQKAIDNVCKHS